MSYYDLPKRTAVLNVKVGGRTWHACATSPATLRSNIDTPNFLAADWASTYLFLFVAYHLMQLGRKAFLMASNPLYLFHHCRIAPLHHFNSKP